MNLNFDFSRIIAGIIRAAKLDVSFFEEAEHDTTYTPDALGAVLLATAAAAIGSFLSSLFGGQVVAGIVALILTAILTVGVYYLWSYLVYFIGTKWFKGQGDVGEVQRCLGFAWGPRALGIFSFIPVLGAIVGFVAWVWSLAAAFIAVRQSMDMDNTNAALTVVISGVISAIIWFILTSVVVGGILAVIFGASALLGR